MKIKHKSTLFLVAVAIIDAKTGVKYVVGFLDAFLVIFIPLFTYALIKKDDISMSFF
jgi:hypothetical protein